MATVTYNDDPTVNAAICPNATTACFNKGLLISFNTAVRPVCDINASMNFVLQGYNL
jgi:hypothetical protein